MKPRTGQRRVQGQIHWIGRSWSVLSDAIRRRVFQSDVFFKAGFFSKMRIPPASSASGARLGMALKFWEEIRLSVWPAGFKQRLSTLVAARVNHLVEPFCKERNTWSVRF